MGLDITAYKKLKPIRDYLEDGDYNPFSETPLYVNPDFPGRCDEFIQERRKLYGFADSFKFYAGSYVGYNAWRDWLAKVAGTSGAFFELIYFSDCEGTIGTAISRKLAADFAAHCEKVFDMTIKLGLASYRQKYLDWQKAFEMASDGGAVKFH